MPEQDFPVKTIIGPDGYPIHYPYIPMEQEPNTTHSIDANQPISDGQEITKKTNAHPLQEHIMKMSHAIGSRIHDAVKYSFDLLVGDDFRKLIGTHSTPLERLQSGFNLASWTIPEAKVTDITAHAIGQAHAITGAAGVIFKETREYSEKYLNRPLTELERQGYFQTWEDFRAFMGPAGKGIHKKDWHHIVERNHEGHFPSEKIHSIHNTVAIPRNIHQKEISPTFQRKDPDLDLDLNGNPQALRDFLKGKSWEEHIRYGEQTLHGVGLNPSELRANTLKTFEKRLKLHDRRFQKNLENLAPHAEHENAHVMKHADYEICATHNGVPCVYSPGQLNQHANVVSLNENTITLRGGDGETIALNRHDLLHNAENPHALDTALKAAHQSGEQVHVSYMNGFEQKADAKLSPHHGMSHSRGHGMSLGRRR